MSLPWQTTIQTLREELQVVQTEYNALLEQQRQELDALGGDTADTADTDAKNELLVKHQRLSQLKQWLTNENRALYRMQIERMIENSRIEQVVNMYLSPPLSDEIPVRFVPLPREYYRKPIDECKQEALAFVGRDNPLSSGVNVFGWKDRRHVTEGTLEFAFEKSFRNHSANELAAHTWSMLTNPKTNTKIYSASMNAKLRILQHIDEDTVLIFWHLRPTHVPVAFKTVYILARVKIDDGVVLVFRTINREDLQLNEDCGDPVLDEAEAPRPIYWSVVNMWTVVRDKSPYECEYHFGGGSKAEMWALELLLMCLRWEAHVFGSRFLVAPMDLRGEGDVEGQCEDGEDNRGGGEEARSSSPVSSTGPKNL